MEVMMVIPQAMLFVQEKGIVTKGVGSHQEDPVDGGKGSSHVRFTCRGDDHRGSSGAVYRNSLPLEFAGHRSGSVRLQTTLVLCRAGSWEDGPVCIEGFPMEVIHAISHVRLFQVAAERFLSFGGAGQSALSSAPDGDIFPRSIWSTRCGNGGASDACDINACSYCRWFAIGRSQCLGSPEWSAGVRAVAGLKFEKAVGVFIGHVEDGFVASVSGTPGEVGPPVRQNTRTALDQAVSVDDVHIVIGATRVLLLWQGLDRGGDLLRQLFSGFSSALALAVIGFRGICSGKLTAGQ
ncbi:hypothetical protein NE237_026787 [Protea cynaroides]|uniref:Uncharacterized protein n=1 Tax=Protea cynaroides TaxID=273540 RepID=A0A9Q0JTI0_9MAGN|nr:hypothetical protein NE237_026787 [Protea cynaroides]